MRARLRRAPTCLAIVAVAVALLNTPAAFATWTTSGSGDSAARALVMPAGNQPQISVSGTSVTVRWSPAALADGHDVAGYVVRRYDANGQLQTVGASCAGVITQTTCTENNVAPGTWTYTDTPVQVNWTGPESPVSSTASVG